MTRPAWILLLSTVLTAPALGGPPAPQTVTYDSPSVGRTLRAIVYLPDGYETSGRRYPVLYLLHGFSGDYTSWTRHGLAQAAAPFDWIVVLPDGGNSWFVNWAESDAGEKNAWEDALVRDLIPYVDAHYRTEARREGRAINGLSMGGYGALAVGLRHPGLFASVGSHSGALDFARGLGKQLRAEPGKRVPDRRPSAKVNAAIGVEAFDSQDERTPHGRIFITPEQCDAHDPFELVARLPADRRPHVYVDCGQEDPFIELNREFARRLLDLKATFSYAESPGEHRSAYWTRAVRDSMAVQHHALRRALDAAKPPPGR